MLANQVAREELTSLLEAECQRELLDEAMARVQLRVHLEHWRIFSALALEKRAGKDVAAEYGVPLATAYSIRSRVQAQIREEMQRLETARPPREREP
jgi:hypothetical protein